MSYINFLFICWGLHCEAAVELKPVVFCMQSILCHGHCVLSCGQRRSLDRTLGGCETLRHGHHVLLYGQRKGLDRMLGRHEALRHGRHVLLYGQRRDYGHNAWQLGNTSPWTSCVVVWAEKRLWTQCLAAGKHFAMDVMCCCMGREEVTDRMRVM